MVRKYKVNAHRNIYVCSVHVSVLMNRLLVYIFTM